MPQLFWQTFQPQKQQYPPRQLQQGQIPLFSAAIAPAVHDNTSLIGQLSRPTGRANALLPNCFALMPSSDLRLPIPHQPYQSGQSQCVYQHTEEKRVYQIDDDLALEVNEEDLDAESFYFTNKGYKEL